LLRVVGRFDVGFAGVPAELVEDVAGVVGEAGEAVAQGLQWDGQAVVLVLAEAGTDEQGQQFEVITQLDEIQLGLFFQQIDHSNTGHGTSISSLKNPGARECGRVPGGQKPQIVGGFIPRMGLVFTTLPAKAPAPATIR